MKITDIDLGMILKLVAGRVKTIFYPRGLLLMVVFAKLCLVVSYLYITPRSSWAVSV